MKKVLVLGCTGSIGTSTLEIVREFPEQFSIVGLVAHCAEEKIKLLSKEFNNVPFLLTKNSSSKELEDFIIKSKADVVINGISGSQGLKSSVITLENGIDLALANKETIVMAGSIIQQLAKKNGCRILPVDSEHSAIFNLVEHYGSDTIQEVILTASGGPFRDFSAEKLRNVSVTDALNHPTWNMGKKITIDSATLANKGLEVIEACRLFNLPPEKVKVVVHPQSLVHSLIRTKDGVLYAQISPPDMKHPILTALTWPNFQPSTLEQLDLTQGCNLTFLPPRFHDFPMLSLAYEAVIKGGSYTIAYNAANEVAVEAFINNKISFTQISEITMSVLQKNWGKNPVTIEDVFLFDTQAREFAKKILAVSTEASF
ncbi:MAG: 1-deoxy-D-xylulose-5-phosphate reductoisomerase [Spirochaetaceae bacterium]|nr:1-deoxy-D-xylulose-5-phosphate reductoisomerase [Spirochaetaceae bacterium]